MGYADGVKHKPIRESCIRCEQPDHDDTEDGNTCRFHKHGKNSPKNVFCATHFSRDNPAVVKYCLNGKPKISTPAAPKIIKGRSPPYDDSKYRWQISDKRIQLRDEIRHFKEGDNKNMVRLLEKDEDKLDQLSEDISYYKKHNNMNMVKLLRRDVNKLG